MEISNIKSSYSTNFTSRKLFAATLYKKTADKVQKPVKAFISELTAEDFGRRDLNIARWRRTKFGADILTDFGDVYSPQLFSEYTTVLPNLGEYRFLAVETPTLKGNKAVSLAEIRILDDFIVLDRLQSLVKSKRAKNRVEGAGSCILYAIANLADKLKKGVVSLEAHEKAVGFYKKAGLDLEKRGNLAFYRLYQPKYGSFMENIGNKFGITPVK